MLKGGNLMSEVYVQHMDEMLETMKTISETLKKLEKNIDLFVSKKQR